MNFTNHAGDAPEVTNSFNSATSPETSSPKKKTAAPFSLRLTAEERALLSEKAGNRPLGAYIRSCLLGDNAQKRRKIRRPSIDHQKLALILSELGRSRLSSNMNQLARAANIGVIDTSDSVIADLQDACRSISDMREMLIAALGLKPERDE